MYMRMRMSKGRKEGRKQNGGQTQLEKRNVLANNS